MVPFKNDLKGNGGLETEFVKILYYHLDKDYSGEYKTFNFPRFCTIVDGEIKVTLENGKILIYNRDNFLLLPSDSNVHMDITKNTKALAFEFSNNLIETVLKKTDILKSSRKSLEHKNYMLGSKRNEIAEDIWNLFVTSREKNNNKKFLIDLYVQKLVYDLIQDESTHDLLYPNDSHPVSKSIKFIDENITNNISVKELSESLYMSESNFSHMFKKNTGCNPIEYIRDKKLDYSKELLKTKSVTETSYDLGYDNISYFIKLFKKKYSLTPKQYQMSVLKSEEQ
ncbi:AraC family transcriptional regulator [Ilyobacter polytropus]|uniref:Transcriptional regulator, AraC family n=1 Tax=Ilyobacter polytropus (strain ATCC 51220 / DSM 2926 / LMG 16218 / CuHBu1) TaxID=572544 RepID=E3HCX2_ILYPC|nr:AraC family transcriptional regulator [Ilyobacter polytropus]ADO84028.1 transcriptional regulator, AraC family [Ilyobacter polytropus DSM 2926]